MRYIGGKEVFEQMEELKMYCLIMRYIGSKDVCEQKEELKMHRLDYEMYWR